MKQILYLGDLNFIWEELSRIENFATEPIFVGPEISNLKGQNVLKIDVNDFHSITIEIYERNPEIVIYNSVLNNFDMLRKYPDQLNISNIELPLHLIEVISILNIPIIFFSYITKGTNDSTIDISIPEDYLKLYSKAIILQFTHEQLNEVTNMMRMVLDNLTSFFGKIVKNY